MKQLDKTGNHIHMSPEEIATRSATVTTEHATYLQKYGVTLPTAQGNSIHERMTARIAAFGRAA